MLHQNIAMENNSELFQFIVANNPSFFDYSSTPMMQQSLCSSSDNNNNYYHPFEVSEITDTPSSQQDRALAALKNHKEAEKRRRERINSHLDHLRTLLPCNSKTDKASLLAKVVERVKELKQQTSQITELETVPSETDEITVISAGSDFTGDGKLIFKASLCCEDRSDLIPELIEILKSLRLKTVKAEICTLGGRTRNVLVVAGDKQDSSIESIHFLQNSLRSLLDRSSGCNDRSKRRRGMDRRMMP